MNMSSVTMDQTEHLGSDIGTMDQTEHLGSQTWTMDQTEHLGSDTGHQSSDTACAHFFNTSYCRFGDKCRYSHSVVSESGVIALVPVEPERFNRTCKHWNRGNCAMGNSCEFKHSLEPPAEGVVGNGTVTSSVRGNETTDNRTATNLGCIPKEVPSELIEAFINGTKHPVSCLMEYASMRRLTPTFHDVAVQNYSPAAKFAFECHIDTSCYPQGTGKSKKEAKTNAAKITLIKLLGLNEDDVNDYQAATTGPLGMDMEPTPSGMEPVELPGMADWGTSISSDCRGRPVQGGMFGATQPPLNSVDNGKQIHGYYPHSDQHKDGDYESGFWLPGKFQSRNSDQHKDDDYESGFWLPGKFESRHKRDENGKRDERSRKHDRKDYRKKSRSPERCRRSPERRRRSPERCRRSPERRRRSPERCRRSPERQRRNSSKQDDSRNSRHDRSPVVPPLGSRLLGTLSRKSEKRDFRFGQAYCEMLPPKVYTPEKNRPNMSQYGTTSVQSHYENERVRMSKASASRKLSKEVRGNIQDPRKPIMGPEISDFIANFIRTVGKSKRGIEIVAKKYHLPGNCIALIPPKMTHDVWDILKKPTQMRDETLQNVQRWLSVGIIPVIHQIDLLGAGAQEAKDVCRLISHSLTVLGFVLLNMSIKRRFLMRNSLHKKYESLCRTSNNVTDLLFGNHLAKDLIEIKFGRYQTGKSSEEDSDDMLSPNYKPTFFAGADVDINVASMINMACANEGDVEDLKENYKIPSNCDTLIPAKINPEMWSLLSRSGLYLDYKLQDVQLSIAEAIVPLMLLLQSVRENSYDPCRALEMLTDALVLLGNAVYQMNSVRMEAMLKTLPEDFPNIGHWCWPGAEQVSGDTLEKDASL